MTDIRCVGENAKIIDIPIRPKCCIIIDNYQNSSYNIFDLHTNAITENVGIFSQTMTPHHPNILRDKTGRISILGSRAKFEFRQII